MTNPSAETQSRPNIELTHTRGRDPSLNTENAIQSGRYLLFEGANRADLGRKASSMGR